MDDDDPNAAQVEKLVLVLLRVFVGFYQNNVDGIGLHRYDKAPGLKNWVSWYVDKSEGYHLSVQEE